VAPNLTQHPNWHLIDHERCGESNSDRIIGGEMAHLGQYPWIARLGYIRPHKGIFDVRKKGFKCGGSLISNVYVLTAAHCVTDLKGDVLALIRLGEHDVRTRTDCEQDKCAPAVQDFAPKEVIVHKNYQNPAMRNDIALIRLDRPATIHSNISKSEMENFILLAAFVTPICLPYGSLLTKNHVSERMEVAGWGVKDINSSKTSDVLLFVRIPVIEGKQCHKYLGKYTPIGKGQLCAGAQVGYDSCGGDSGGPLMHPEAPDGLPKYFLIGIVSFGSVRCGSDAPAVYTDVAYYMKWILKNID
ncbi:serine protease easter-like, partial [Asbolus verrucosus]